MHCRGEQHPCAYGAAEQQSISLLKSCLRPEFLNGLAADAQRDLNSPAEWWFGEAITSLQGVTTNQLGALGIQR